MSSLTTREAKNAAKAQKKTQKANKKQQQKIVQQQQSQQQQSTLSENAKSTTSTAAAVTTTTVDKLNNNKLLGKSSSKSPTTIQNMNNNNNVAKDSTTTVFLRPHPQPSPSLQQQQQQQFLPPGYENAPKFERSNSFSLKGKLSKLINSLTGSKENLSTRLTTTTTTNNNNTNHNKNINIYDENGGLIPYTFTRSRSLILPRRSNRRSLIEPQLEQLSEEAEKLGNDPTSPSSPRKNSVVEATKNYQKTNGNGSLPVATQQTSSSTVKGGVATTTNTKDAAMQSPKYQTPPNRRQSSSQVLFTSSTPNETITLNESESMSSHEFSTFNEPASALSLSSLQQRKNSTLSLAALPTSASAASATTNNATPFNPQLNFQKRRSNTLIASFRSTLASLTGGGGGGSGGGGVGSGASGSGGGSGGGGGSTKDKKDKLNPKWSASLQSLQAIDNMVSYENMSFIDYDKFNGYEKQLEKRLSTLSLFDANANATAAVVEPPRMQSQTLPLPNTTPTILMGPPSQTPQPLTHQKPETPTTPTSSTASTVVLRRQRHSRKRSESSISSNSRVSCGINNNNINIKNASSQQNLTNDRSSFIFDTNYEHNLDKFRNVYRDSLDSRKLLLLNDIMGSSLVLDTHIIDILNLEDGSVGRRRSALRKQLSIKSRNGAGRGYTSAAAAAGDEVDSNGKVQMKSKSLTHLDGIDSIVASPHCTATTTTITSSNSTTSKALNNRGKSNTVSSSEYFSISFCTETGPQEEEFIPAIRGVTLANAISNALQRRNLSFSQISITDNNPTSSFLDAGNSPLAISLDENTDVENLVGRHLVIIEKDGNRKPLQKAASFGSRTRPPRLLSSASTEETSESASSSKQLKQRWSGLFGIKNPQQSQLCELLNNYSKNGVPQRIANPLNFTHHNLESALRYLDDMHKSWRDFVQDENMPENEAKIQTAIWELVTTEVYYIHALQTVTDLFLACLEAVQDQSLLIDVDQNRLFANVREICEANLKFWTFYLYPMVAHSIATHEPMCITFFEEGFLTFKLIFEPYTQYCAEQSSCQFYCKELNRNNALFTAYLAWCESQKMCNRLRLADILVRPMQRLTKYSLLLAAIKKHMILAEDIEAIDAMVHCVENFVTSVNNHLTQRQEEERIKGVMARIESYEIVPNTNNEIFEKIIKQFGASLDLCSHMKYVKPAQMRHLFMEGDHKFKDHLGKLDVHCFLFTDLLLVCKNVAKKGLGTVKVIRQPYFTDRLLVHQTNNVLHCVYLNELSLAITAFTLQCAEAKNWFEALKRARNCYTKLKATSANYESAQPGAMSAAGLMASTAAAAAASMNTLMGSGGGGGGGGGGGSQTDTLSIKKSSPLSSALCSHRSSANNSHSGSVELYDSRNISVDCEKTNSLSSDDGSGKIKNANKLKVTTSTANTLSVQPTNSLVQSLPNLNLHANQNNNTLLVPGTRHSRNLLSPNFHNISYPPPSPTRTQQLRRVSAVANKNNPPLVKTRNITSQSSINWHQIPATPTPPSHNSPAGDNGGGSGTGGNGGGVGSGSGSAENDNLKASNFGGSATLTAMPPPPPPPPPPSRSPNYFYSDFEHDVAPKFASTPFLPTTISTTDLNSEEDEETAAANRLQQQHQTHHSTETDV